MPEVGLWVVKIKQARYLDDVGLRERLIEAKMPAGVVRRFADALRAVAESDGYLHSSELLAIEGMLHALAPDTAELAPFEALWPYRELLVTASLYVAVSDGSYAVEEARKVSELAHRLGLSAHQLARIEDEVFTELKNRRG